MIIFYIITVILGVSSIVLLSGKGVFLISGYNTLSAQEKAKYNEKKLCRVVGSGMLCLTAGFLLVSIVGMNCQWAMILFTGIIVIAVVGMMVLSKWFCYSDEYKENPEKFKTGSSLNHKVKSILGIVIGAVALVVFIVFLFISETGDIKMKYEDSSFTAQAPFWKDKTVDYSTIKSVTYRDDLKKGSKSIGMNGIRLDEGTFKNEEFGTYSLYVYNNCSVYVVLDTTEGYVVVNGATAEDTQNIYHELSKKVQK